MELYDEELDREAYKVGIRSLSVKEAEFLKKVKSQRPDFLTAKLVYKMMGYVVKRQLKIRN